MKSKRRLEPFGSLYPYALAEIEKIPQKCDIWNTQRVREIFSITREVFIHEGTFLGNPLPECNNYCKGVLYAVEDETRYYAIAKLKDHPEIESILRGGFEILGSRPFVRNEPSLLLGLVYDGNDTNFVPRKIEPTSRLERWGFAERPAEEKFPLLARRYGACMMLTGTPEDPKLSFAVRDYRLATLASDLYIKIIDSMTFDAVHYRGNQG